MTSNYQKPQGLKSRDRYLPFGAKTNYRLNYRVCLPAAAVSKPNSSLRAVFHYCILLLKTTETKTKCELKRKLHSATPDTETLFQATTALHKKSARSHLNRQEFAEFVAGPREDGPVKRVLTRSRKIRSFKERDTVNGLDGTGLNLGYSTPYIYVHDDRGLWRLPQKCS